MEHVVHCWHTTLWTVIDKTAICTLQWGKLASGDKAHAYALTGAGVVGIVRVDCLEQDEPKESFRCV